TIEASSREEALAELKAKLGDEVPADVLEFVVSKFEEHAKYKDHGELLIDTLDEANATRRKVTRAQRAVGDTVRAALDAMFGAKNVKEVAEGDSETAA